MNGSPSYPILHRETSLSDSERGEKTHLLDHDFTPRHDPRGYYQLGAGPAKVQRGQTYFIFSILPFSFVVAAKYWSVWIWRFSVGPSLQPPPQPWLKMSSTLPSDSAPSRNSWKGPCLAFMSGTFFTLGATGVKYLSDIDPMELLIVRSILQILVMLPIAGYCKLNLLGPKGSRILVQLQGIVGGITLVLLFLTFRRLPLGDATAIIFSSPVFVMVLSFIVLREPCGFFRTFIVCLLCLGVILIAKPPFIFQFFVHTEGWYDLLGYMSAVLATLFTALNIVIMRKCKEVHFSVVVLSLSMWSLVTSGGLLAISYSFGESVSFPASLKEWYLTAFVSFLGLSGQVLVALALGLEGAGKVSVIRSLDIILAFILQVTIFHEIPDWMSGLGATAVLTCVVGMTFEPQIKELFNRIP